MKGRFPIQAGFVLHQAYIPEKCRANRTENFHLKQYTGLFISSSGTSELDCATTKKDTAERSISVGRESLKVFFLY